MPNKSGKPFTRKVGKSPAHGAPYGQQKDKRGQESLKFAAVHMPDGITYCGGAKSHAQARSHVPGSQGWTTFQLDGEIAGFITTHGRFLTRAEAVPIGVAAKQLREDWLTTRRPLLSSDINW